MKLTWKFDAQRTKVVQSKHTDTAGPSAALARLEERDLLYNLKDKKRNPFNYINSSTVGKQ